MKSSNAFKRLSFEKAKNLEIGFFIPKSRFYFFHVNIFNLIYCMIFQIFPLSFHLYTEDFRILSAFSQLYPAFTVFVFYLKDYSIVLGSTGFSRHETTNSFCFPLNFKSKFTIQSGIGMILFEDSLLGSVMTSFVFLVSF